MNKAFHHLVAVLDCALDEALPSLAFFSSSEEAVYPLVQNLKNSCRVPFFSAMRNGAFYKALFKKKVLATETYLKALINTAVTCQVNHI